MRLLILAKDYPPTVGGVENYSKNLAEGLSNYYETRVISFESDSAATFSDKIKVYRIKPVISSELIKAMQMFFLTLRIALSWKPTHYIATTWKVGVPLLILKYLVM